MNRPPAWASWLGGSLLGAGILALVFVAASYWFLGSPAHALAYLGGKRVVASPSIYDFGEGHIGDSRTAVFTVRNLGGSEVTITGGQTACTCIKLGKYPVPINPNGSVDLSFTIRLSAQNPSFSQPIILYTDLPNQPTLALQVEGRVLTPRPH